MKIIVERKLLRFESQFKNSPTHIDIYCKESITEKILAQPDPIVISREIIYILSGNLTDLK